MLFKRGDTILFTGDSITDAGRTHAKLGPESHGFGGYVSVISNALPFIRVLNTGISGNTIRDLAARWDRDVTALSPDYLSIMIGVNDVWRSFDHPDEPELAVSLEEFTATYRRLIERSRALVKGIILITPFLAEADTDYPMRAKLAGYTETVRSLAREYGCILVDIQSVFDEYIRKGIPQGALSADRVHPAPIGAAVIAMAVLHATGFPKMY